MSTEEPSKCCVCGEPTTKRCQACAKSGIDLFFCSPEHQKLVWKHHKKVCGLNAYSFRYPPLSPEEVDLLRSNAHKVIDLSKYKDNPSIAMLPEKVMTAETYVETLSFGKKGDFEHVLQRLQKPGSVKDLFYTIGLAAARAALSAVDAFRRSGAVGLTDGTVWSHISVICGKASARAQSIEARTSSYHFGKKLPHALCTLFALLTARQEQEQGCDAVPPAWLHQALETVVECYADIQPFSSESEAVAALGSLAALTMPIQQVRLVGVKDRQTGKISVKCVG
ncbi:hypothetical protein NBRC10512_001288 [Rhodotorula toruloides]